MTKYVYTFRLTSASNYIDLYEKLTNVSSCRIKTFRYTTQTTGGLYAILTIAGFNNNILLDSGTIRKYCKLILMPDVASGIISYENASEIPDVKTDSPQDLSGFVCDVQFGLSSGSIVYSPDITSATPVVIEIEFIAD